MLDTPISSHSINSKSDTVSTTNIFDTNLSKNLSFQPSNLLSPSEIHFTKTIFLSSETLSASEINLLPSALLQTTPTSVTSPLPDLVTSLQTDLLVESDFDMHSFYDTASVPTIKLSSVAHNSYLQSSKMPQFSTTLSTPVVYSNSNSSHRTVGSMEITFSKFLKNTGSIIQASGKVSPSTTQSTSTINSTHPSILVSDRSTETPSLQTSTNDKSNSDKNFLKAEQKNIMKEV